MGRQRIIADNALFIAERAFSLFWQAHYYPETSTVARMYILLGTKWALENDQRELALTLSRYTMQLNEAF